MGAIKKASAGCGILLGAFFLVSILSAVFSTKDSASRIPPVEKRNARQAERTTKSTRFDVLAAVADPVVEESAPTREAASVSAEPLKSEAPGLEVELEAPRVEVIEAELFKAEPRKHDATPEAVAALIPTLSRKWSNPEGRSVLGIVTAFDTVAETVTLRTAEGRTIENFPLSEFSGPDSKYLRDAAAGILSGQVVGVHDGDSLTLLVAGNTQFKIRLEAIDAPEIGQEYGNNAKEGLSELVHGKEVTVHVTGFDKYKRTLGFVWIANILVNQAMIERGLAWHFKEYSDDAKLSQIEVSARAAKSGLWRDFKPMAPWDWRDLQRANAAARRTPSTAPQPFVSEPPTGPAPNAATTAGFWLNTSGGKRHNKSCRWYGNTKSGRYCTNSEGSACGTCGG